MFFTSVKKKIKQKRCIRLICRLNKIRRLQVNLGSVFRRMRPSKGFSGLALELLFLSLFWGLDFTK